MYGNFYKNKLPIYFIPNLIAIDEIFIKLTDQSVPFIAPYYIISNYGRIYNIYEKRFLTPSKDSKGYYRVSITIKNNGKSIYKNKKIHRLIMMEFNYIQNCEFLEVNHKDGDKSNNCIYNLEWCTGEENQKHATQNGLKAFGDKCPMSKITNIQAYDICVMLSNGIDIDEIADKFNVNRRIIYGIYHRKNWNKISNNFIFFNYELDKENKVRKVCELLSKGHSVIDIYNYINMNYNFVYMIYTRRNWINISKDYIW